MKVRQLPPPPPCRGLPNLIVAGFMGTGKTTVGSRVGRLLGLPFIDLDQVAGARAGISVPDLIRRDGEGAFRDLERQLLAELGQVSGAVVATGGGAPLAGDVFLRALNGNLCVVLTAEVGDLCRRLGRGSDRPLLPSCEPLAVGGLLAQREGAYSELGQMVDTTGRSVEQVAQEVAGIYRSHVPDQLTKLKMTAGARDTEIVLGPGAADCLGSALGRLLPQVRRVHLVTDSGLPAAVEERLGAALLGAGVSWSHRSVPGGEAAKSQETLTELWSWMLEAEADRGDVMVAVGGGAVLDGAGFAAATFARGIPAVNVPTTILAMADAAIGGKTAINFGGVKNPIGAFHHPVAVFADPSLLGGLAREGSRSGMAEVIKCGVLGPRLVLDQMRLWGDAWENPANLAWLLGQSVLAKAAHVQADPEEHGLRMALNLGHTFAHGLESATGYGLPHGDAVGIGLLAAAGLGAELGLGPSELASELKEILRDCRLPTAIPDGIDRQRVEAAIRRDKKRRSGRAAFVVPGRNSGVALVEEIDVGSALAQLWALAQRPEAIVPAPPPGCDGP